MMKPLRSNHPILLRCLPAIGLLWLIGSGCVQRQMDIRTDPPGAVVFMNDREIGRTPFNREFLWYGVYDVVIRKDGYQTLKTTATINPPLWQLVPLDLVTDFLPLKDERVVSFSLKPDAPVDPAVLMQNAEQMQGDLESSEHTIHHHVMEVHPPAPSVHPASRPASTQPATQPTPSTPF
jgi:hypothetical protein